MTSKDCGQHDNDRKKLYHRLLVAAASLIIIVLFIVLIVWLILRPTKPHFMLQDATVTAFYLTSPTTLTTSLQITLYARNPNDKVGIYYDKVDVYAAYRNQQITLATIIPPTYQGHKDVSVWSPYLNGISVPVAPYLAESLHQDQNTGAVLLNIKIDGRIRWKVGTWISGSYHMFASCPAFISFGNRYNGIAVGGGAVKYQLIMDCHVDV